MKKKTLVFFITCFTGLCAYLFIFFYSEAEKTAIRQLNEEQKIHAKQAAHGIEDFFATWTGILNSFSKIDAIINADSEGKQHMALFYESHQEQIRSITRVDEKGRILRTVPHIIAIGSDISGQKHVREILRDHKPVVSDVFRTVQGFDAVALHVPVFREAAFKGTIAIVVDFEKLAKSYLEVIKIGRTGYAWVVSSDGTTLYSPLPGFTGKSVFDNYRDSPSVFSMTKDMLQGHEGTAAYTFDKIGDQTVAPVKKYAVYIPIHIANSFWSVVVASSEDEVLSSIAFFRNRLLLVIGMILLGGVLFSIIGAKAWLIVVEEEKRKKAEEKMRASEKLYRTLFEQSPIGLALCRMDGGLVEVNPAYAGIIGRSVEETLTLSYWDITPKNYEEQELAQMKSLEETGRYGPYEKEYLHRDGRPVPVRLQGLLIEKEGEKFIWSSAEDITERKKSEMALKLSEEKFRSFVEQSSEGVYLFELEEPIPMTIPMDEKIKKIYRGYISECNNSLARMYGYASVDELKGVSLSVLHGGVDKPENIEFIRSWILSNYRIVNAESSEVDSKGNKAWFSNNVIGMVENGYLTRAWGTQTDITERKQQEEELIIHRDHLEEMVTARTHDLGKSRTALQYLLEDVNEANKKLQELDHLKSMFIASMSHELRTPLNSIIGFIGIILQDMAGDISDEQREMLNRSYGAAKHLLALISDVIDISKIEAGKIEAFAEEFMLHDLMEQAFSTLKTDIDAKGLLLETEIPEDIKLNTDRQRLLQCVLNFLSNAVKYSEKGKIKVTAVKEGETVEIRFTDTGIGIKDEDMPKLFGSFVRLDSPLRVTTKGTGLGLYLTKKLTTEVLNGTIEVKSVLGEGSTFILKVPATLL